MKPTHPIRGGLVCALLAAMLAVPARCPAWNRSEIRWLSIQTEHFSVQYHAGLERYATDVAAIAEAIYGPITTLYGYEPDGLIYFNISDLEDDPQGATYYYLNRIDISVSPYDFWFRGSAAWLENVVAHEFTHMISLQKTMKFPLWLPAGFFQTIDFEREKRPDVLMGYPNLMVSVPIPGEVVPNWLAEGMAQFQCGAARHDTWDSHRDMLLRSAFLGGNLLTLDEMGVFGKDSRESELVYNQGFSLVRFIAKRFGPDRLCALATAYSGARTWGFPGACRRALGVEAGELYRLWTEDLEASYRPLAARVRSREVAGERVAGKGFLNLFPVTDPDGGLWYLSNRGRDYMGLDIVRRGADGAERSVVSDAGARADVSRDGTRICFPRTTRRNKRGYLLSDIFIRNAAGGKERRLTRGLRAAYPAWSPDGARIACVVTETGSHRIAVVDAATGAHEYLTPPVRGREYTSLSWSERGVLASRFEGESRDIVLIDPASRAETPVVSSGADERDPRWSGEGDGFFYASDRTGIFNVYYRSMADSTDLMATNVLGGAFSPAERGGDLIYSGYGAAGFEIFRVRDWRRTAVPADPADDDETLMRARRAIAAPAGRDSADVDAALDALVRSPEKPFGIQYTKTFVYPRVMIYDGVFRAGAFLDSGDFLDRQTVFGGFTYGTNGDFDFNLSIATRQFKPTFGFDIYRIRKHYGYTDAVDLNDDGSESLVDFKIRYDLWDAYFTCGLEFRPTGPFARNEAVLQYNHGEYGVNVELWELLARREFRGEGGWNYYLADEASLLWHYKSIRREVDADINPRAGRALDLEITRAWDKLHSGEFEYVFRPRYDKSNFWRFQLQYDEHLPLPFWRHALSLRFRGATLDRSDIDDFFYLYLGSADGLRGYTYYSLGGQSIAMARFTYRFPLWREINRQVAPLYLGSLYAGAFFEAGDAWTGDAFDVDNLKRDAGFELRFKGFTFHAYPIAMELQGAYGLDEIVYTKPFEFTTVYEGKRWKWFANVLFSF